MILLFVIMWEKFLEESPMTRNGLLTGVLTLATCVTSNIVAVPALAGDIEALGNGDITIQQAASMMYLLSE